jgi:HAE1 family hydrophobic/amphiphilic exporter-1
MRPKFAAVSGGAAFQTAPPDIKVGARITKTEYQYTLEDADLAELNGWAPKVLARLQSLPMLRDVATDQQAAARHSP